jgi:hypothetical protein
LLVTGFWMLPAALDRAVQESEVATLKVASLVVAGLVTGASWQIAGHVIQSFFVLNWFWMTLAVGLLYQELPQQLCSVYLAEQQDAAGAAMVAWAMLGLALWLPGVLREPDETCPPLKERPDVGSRSCADPVRIHGVVPHHLSTAGGQSVGAAAQSDQPGADGAARRLRTGDASPSSPVLECRPTGSMTRR